MASITYNGVFLTIGKFLDFSVHAVYSDDGVDFLYNHYQFNLECVFNPQATASNILPGQGGDVAPVSIANLHDKLMRPRKPLVINLGGTDVFASPPTFVNAGVAKTVTVDAKNGPHPIRAQVVAEHGTKTAIVHYQIETFLNQCTTFASAMISHRWSATDSLDDQYLCTRTIRGTAVFRSDLLQLGSLNPDNYRSQLFFPVFDGFKRESIDFTVNESNLTVHYTVTDKEKVWNLDPTRGVARIGGGLDLGLDWTGSLPVMQSSFVLQVWGVRNITYSKLINAAINAAGTYGNEIAGRLMRSYNLHVDFADRYVEIRFQQVSNGIAGGIKNFFFAPALADFATCAVKENIGTLAQTAVAPNIAPQTSNKSRGLYLQTLVAQGLKGDCTSPPEPANFPGGDVS